MEKLVDKMILGVGTEIGNLAGLSLGCVGEPRKWRAI